MSSLFPPLADPAPASDARASRADDTGLREPRQPHRALHLRVTIVVFTLVLLVAAWVTIWVVIARERGEVIEAQTRHNTNLAEVLREQTERVLASVDQATLRARDAVASGGLTAPDLQRLANETGLAPKILVQLSVVGPDGRFVGSNLDPDGSRTGHVDLSAREHIRVHLAPALAPQGKQAVPANGLFIGKPVLGKVSGRWTIQLSRAITAADGRRLGVIVASLDPGYFDDVYRQVALGHQGVVTLVGSDLTVRARVVGGQPAKMGATLASVPELAQAGAPVRGSFVHVSAIDGVERYSAYSRVGSHPLFVLVGSGLDESLADWRDTRNALLVLTGAFTLLIGAAAVALVVGVRRLEQVNAELMASQRAAHAASEAKSEFLAAISHELRTPLTSIRGFAELMEKRLPDEKFRKQAGMIRRGAEHLNNLLTEILDLTKVEAGVMPHMPTSQNLRQVLADTREFFLATAAHKQLSLEVRVADALPATITCDGLRLKQILNNLLSNALKFTERGGVVIAAERLVAVAGEPRGDRIALHVIDSGPGIAEDMQEAVFERFRQGSERISHDHGGTGLGLALSRGLAQLMGGTLTLRSTLGVGSRFTLVLPLDATARPAPAARDAAASH
ncbi:MAG: ATP-binding protein [Burkholderiaceae bacterium]|nr:ATP-binding protein [Burkholderiaceae bacterium]